MQDLDKFELRLYNLYETESSKPSQNIKLMKDFIEERKHKKISERTLATNCQVFLFFSKWCDKPISTMSKYDIYDFLNYLKNHTYIRGGKTCHYSESTILTHKRILGKFFKQSGYKKLAKHFKQKSEPIEEVDRKRLLTKDEIEKLINTARTPRDKALIATLYESGARRGELLSCNVEDVEFDSTGCIIFFPESKTKKRRVRLVYAASFLRNWIENHPNKLGNGETDQAAPLWTTSYAIKGKYNRFTDMAFHFQLKKLVKKAGITKRIYPHLFRHTRATDLSEHLTESQLKKHFGWKQSSTMTAKYVHDPDTENAILKMNGIEIEDTHVNRLSVSRCPRCKEIQNDQEFCFKCGYPLHKINLDTDTEVEKVKKEFEIRILEVERDAYIRPYKVEIDDLKYNIEESRKKLKKLSKEELKAEADKMLKWNGKIKYLESEIQQLKIEYQFKIDGLKNE